MTSRVIFSPVEEYAQHRAIRQNDAEQRIASAGRNFLSLQLTAGGTYGFVQLAPFSPSWPPDFSTYAILTVIAVFLAASLFSLYFAGRAANVVIANWDVLEAAWHAIGFAPWGLLMLEVTIFFVLTGLY